MKDMQTLERGAKLVEVERNEDTWELRPMRRVHGGRLRTRQDEEHAMTRTVTLPAASDEEEIGAALKGVLAGPTPTV